MKISLIVATAHHRVIGRNNQLPWHLPADLQYFKKMTLGKPIIMGRNCYESIGRPLPNRHNIVVSRNPEFTAPGCTVVHDFPAALQAAGAVDEVMVIGGAQIYEIAFPLADTIYLTEIDADISGDTYFPKWDPKEWTEDQREQHQAEPYSFAFVTLNRR